MKKELTENRGYKYNPKKPIKKWIVIMDYKVTEYKVDRKKLMETSMEGIFRAYAGMSNKKMMF